MPRYEDADLVGIITLTGLWHATFVVRIDFRREIEDPLLCYTSLLFAYILSCSYDFTSGKDLLSRPLNKND